ncbi:hypothetical protein CWO91_25210 [Bradyrhizobium genosp. SA-3]|nr:hypothetical protein CWO91_25210 [Bradyrhizobium genosp. SA-3]
MVRAIRLAGYIDCRPEFDKRVHMLDTASAFLIQVVGERGRQSQLAVGCATLPATSRGPVWRHR